jgi:hypothetical protein
MNIHTKAVGWSTSKMGEEPEFSSPPKQTKPKAPMRFSFYNKVKPIPENDNNALTTEFSAEILQQEPPSEQRSKKFGGKLGRKKRLKSAPPERLKQTGSEELVPEVSPGVSQVSIADSGFVPEDSRSPSGSGPRDINIFSGRGSGTRIAHSREQSIGSGKMEELQSHASTMLSKLSEAQMEWSRMEEELLQLRAENEQLHFEHVQLKANYKQTEEDSALSKEKFVEAQTAVQSLRQENTSLKTALESVQSGHLKLTRDVKEIYDVLTATVTEYYNISPNEVKSRLENLSKLLQDLVEREQGLQNGKEDSSLKEDDVCVSVKSSALINDSSSQTRRDLPRVSSALRNANGVKNGCIATSSGYLRLDDEVGEDPPIDEIHDTVWLPDNQQSSPTSHKERKASSNW